MSEERELLNALSQEIRRVDGNHDLGAGALAEALMPFLSERFARPPALGVEAVAWREAVARIIQKHVKARPSGRVMLERITGTYEAADAVLAALPYVPVGGLGASAAPIPTERLERAVVAFQEALAAVPDVAERQASGDQFNAYSIGDEDDHVSAVCLGPITRKPLSLVEAPEDVAELLTAGLRLSCAFVAVQQAATSDDKQPGTEASEGRCSAPNLPTEDAAGGWIDHDGGPNPVPGQRVDVRQRDGSHFRGFPSDDAEEFWTWPDIREGDDTTEGDDIIAYRIAAPTTPASLDGDAT